MPNAIAGEMSTASGKPGHAFAIKAAVAAVPSYYTRELPKNGRPLLAAGKCSTGSVFAVFAKGSEVSFVGVIVADKNQQLTLVPLVKWL